MAGLTKTKKESRASNLLTDPTLFPIYQSILRLAHILIQVLSHNEPLLTQHFLVPSLLWEATLHNHRVIIQLF